MTDYPIIFSPEMVEALLAGRKIMTRRARWVGRLSADGIGSRESSWARVKVGDRLWVRERHRRWGLWDYQPDRERKWRFWTSTNACDISFEPPFDTVKRWPGRLAWFPRPSIFLPRALSRITLVVTKAPKIERLWDITDEDAVAEGIECDGTQVQSRVMIPRLSFGALWRTIHGAESWGRNPEVVALTFSAMVANIDSLEAQAA